MKYRCAGEVGAIMGAIFYAAFGGENRTTGLRPSENHTTALRARKGIPPLVAGATTFLPQAGALWVLSHGAMSLSIGKHRAIYSVPRMGWQGNTIRKGAKRPENRVTRFPVEKVRRSRIRESRVAANHQNANQAL